MPTEAKSVATEAKGVPTEAKGVPTDTPSFDRIKDAQEARDRVYKWLDVSEELSQINSEEMRVTVQALIDRAKSKFNALIAQGDSASANQALVVLLVWSESEDELASNAEASDADKEILQAIQGKFAKARVPFWTALASLGKVKEWSASLEISAGFFAVKGTGGISVTFGR